MKYRILSSVGFAVLLLYSSVSAQVVREVDRNLKKIDIVEHLGDTIPLDLNFLDSDSNVVTLGDFFGLGIPVIIVMHYINCPMLCSLVLNGLSDGINGLKLVPGKDFRLIAVSIDPKETIQNTAGAQERYMGTLEHAGTKDAWKFLISPEDNSARLADVIGFKYFYDVETKQYAHPAGAFIITDKGVISRYLYGVEFKPQDLRFALLEASEGKIGGAIDRIILYCYHYDPNTEGYVLLAGNVMKLGGYTTVVVLAVFFGLLWFREKSKKSAEE